MLDLGLTMVDLCFWLAGNPVPSRVSANLTKPKGERGVEQSGSCFVVCEGGLAIAVDVTWRHIGEQERFGVGLRGSKGTAGINPLHVWKELNGVAQDVSPTGSLSRESAFTASFRAQWAHFLAAVAGEAKVPKLSEHITLLKVIEAIYKSAAEGKDVAL
jgi:predicted dehydrogenase